ncbi:MAG: type II toxin-antitoxin system VapC family toxin [Pyrinomonadaceae bacterium]
MRSRIYIETSVVSFYHEVRTEPDMIARRDWTRRFWDGAVDEYTLLTSPAVIEELEQGDFPNQQMMLDLVSTLTVLPVDQMIGPIVDFYIMNLVMPNNPKGDALHLALASYHKCDFLLTWNCKHLANANKFGHIRQTNDKLGLYTPLLVTPLELLGEPL